MSQALPTFRSLSQLLNSAVTLWRQPYGRQWGSKQVWLHSGETLGRWYLNFVSFSLVTTHFSFPLATSKKCKNYPQLPGCTKIGGWQDLNWPVDHSLRTHTRTHTQDVSWHFEHWNSLSLERFSSGRILNLQVSHSSDISVFQTMYRTFKHDSHNREKAKKWWTRIKRAMGWAAEHKLLYAGNVYVICWDNTSFMYMPTLKPSLN